MQVTQAQLDKMEEAARLGVFWRSVATLGGIEWETFRAWMREGRQDPNSVHRAFCTRLIAARAEGLLTLLRRQHELATGAAKGDGRAVVWLLERVHQYHSLDPDAAEVTGVEANPTGGASEAASKLAEALQGLIKT